MAEEMNVQQEGQGVQESQGIDYEKLASILDGKMKVTEDSVLKGYFKQQGLTGDEMSQAIEAFKADKASKTPNFDDLNRQISDMDDALLEAESRALFAETQIEAMGMATELGVDAKTIPYVLRMADISDVITDGQVDQDKLKKSLADVLKDLPQLKVKEAEKATGFKIGVDSSNQRATTNEELAQIFGVKKK